MKKTKTIKLKKGQKILIRKDREDGTEDYLKIRKNQDGEIFISNHLSNACLELKDNGFKDYKALIK